MQELYRRVALAEVSQDLLELRRANTLSSLIADKIEGFILSGALSAGDRINEVTLAREMGVSRGPIREASRLLSSKGLVEIVANKGAYVRRISREDLLEIYDLRAVLTGHACQLAAQSGAKGVAALKALHEKMNAAAEVEDAAVYYKLNLKFHDELINMARSVKLKAMLDALIKEAHLFRQLSLIRHPDMAQSNREHGEIMDAIANGDGEAARTLGEAHVRAGKQRFEAAATKTLLTEAN